MSMNKRRRIPLKRLYKSVGAKLFLVIFFGIMVCVLSVGIFSYVRSKAVIQDQVKDSNLQTITSASDKLDLLFNSIDNLKTQFTQDESLKELDWVK